MSSKRHRRRYTCERKVRHPTERDARAALGGDVQSVYACPHCGGWHIGHAPGFQLRQRARGFKGRMGRW